MCGALKLIWLSGTSLEIKCINGQKESHKFTLLNAVSVEFNLFGQIIFRKPMVSDTVNHWGSQNLQYWYLCFIYFPCVTISISQQDLHCHYANGGSRFDRRRPHFVSNQKTSLLCITFSPLHVNTSFLSTQSNNWCVHRNCFNGGSNWICIGLMHVKLNEWTTVVATGVYYCSILQEF